jgi:hypothetical protein
MPAAHHIILLVSSIVLKLLNIPIFFVLPTSMPPLSVYSELHRAEKFALSFNYGQLLEASAMVLIAATVLWFLVALLSRKKSRKIGAGSDVSRKPHSKPFLERKDSAICQKHWEINHADHLSSLKQEIHQHTETPIYPWILPPQTLPGPYDPMYFPLPAPTIQAESSGPSQAKCEGRHSTSYTRLVPNIGTPPGEAILYGTITTSTNGWRRTHWNVTGG